MKKISIILMCITVLISIFSNQADAKTFPIGALFPMTGPQAYYGRVMSRGALLAIEHLNTVGGSEGYSFKLVITDFKNVDLDAALAGVQKMGVIDKIPVMLTSFSAITLGVQQSCADKHILMINGGAYSPKLADKPYLYSTKLSQTRMVPPMLRYFWEMGIRRLGVIYVANPAGEIPAEQLIQPLWTKMGGTILSLQSHPPGLTNYNKYLSPIKEGNPDAVYDISTGQDQAYVIKNAREMGINVPMTVPDWNDDFYSVAGKTSENVYIPGDYFDLNSSDKDVQRFVKDYETKWKESPDIFAANYYEAVYYIIPELIKRVVKNNGNPMNGEELEKAVWSNPSFKTVYGETLTFNRDGSSNKPMAIFKVIDGKKVVQKQVMSE